MTFESLSRSLCMMTCVVALLAGCGEGTVSVTGPDSDSGTGAGAAPEVEADGELRLRPGIAVIELSVAESKALYFDWEARTVRATGAAVDKLVDVKPGDIVYGDQVAVRVDSTPVAAATSGLEFDIAPLGLTDVLAGEWKVDVLPEGGQRGNTEGATQTLRQGLNLGSISLGNRFQGGGGATVEITGTVAGDVINPADGAVFEGKIPGYASSPGFRCQEADHSERCVRDRSGRCQTGETRYCIDELALRTGLDLALDATVVVEAQAGMSLSDSTRLKSWQLARVPVGGAPFDLVFSAFVDLGVGGSLSGSATFEVDARDTRVRLPLGFEYARGEGLRPLLPGSDTGSAGRIDFRNRSAAGYSLEGTLGVFAKVGLAVSLSPRAARNLNLEGPDMGLRFDLRSQWAPFGASGGSGGTGDCFESSLSMVPEISGKLRVNAWGWGTDLIGTSYSAEAYRQVFLRRGDGGSTCVSGERPGACCRDDGNGARCVENVTRRECAGIRDGTWHDSLRACRSACGGSGPGGGSESNCTDDRDNDGDGRADCRDADCEDRSCGSVQVCRDSQCVYDAISGNERACAGPNCCGDGGDNDGDGKIDCADRDCLGVECASGKICRAQRCVDPQTDESGDETTCLGSNCCGDGSDNDHDGQRDCRDSDCDGRSCGTNSVCRSGSCTAQDPQNTPSREDGCSGGNCCGDGVDNDRDGRRDCADADCMYQSCGRNKICKNRICSSQAPPAPSREDGCSGGNCCADGSDNDRDGRKDCRDPDCLYQVCGADSICQNGSCAWKPPAKETGCSTGNCCGDGRDNDNDGQVNIDCKDTDCHGQPCGGGKHCQWPYRGARDQVCR